VTIITLSKATMTSTEASKVENDPTTKEQLEADFDLNDKGQ
jgi:hypothetical protein